MFEVALFLAAMAILATLASLNQTELIPELEETRRGTEALQALEAGRAVGPLVEAETAEKECCICLKAEEVEKLLAPVPCRL
jgi:hypothetical protein